MGLIMYPAGFDESNQVLSRPDNMTDDQCGPLSVYKGAYQDGTPCVISCWKMTKAEMEEVIETGRVWISVIGASMPPLYVGGTNPFKESTDASQPS